MLSEKLRYINIVLLTILAKCPNEFGRVNTKILAGQLITDCVTFASFS